MMAAALKHAEKGDISPSSAGSRELYPYYLWGQSKLPYQLQHLSTTGLCDYSKVFKGRQISR